MASAAPNKKQLALLKKDLVTVKGNIKSGKDLEKTENIVRKHLADSAFHGDVHLWQTLCDVLKRAYEVGNEKMYLKLPTDTTCLIKTGKRMFLAYEKLDSIYLLPDGRITSNASLRRRNATYLTPFRPNIFIGGIYFMHRKEWREAWECFDIYLQCPVQPLFNEMKLPPADSTACRVAFLSLVTAQKLNNFDYALRYADKSVMSNHRSQALQILSDMSLNHDDTLHYKQYITEGFRDYPLSDYFFPHLVEYYTTRKMFPEALAVCDTALTVDTLNPMFLLGQNSVYMQTRQYDEAIRSGELLIRQDDTIATPYYNIGYIHYQRAQQALHRKGRSYSLRMKEAQKHFRLCLPFMERYRSLMPADRAHWHPILYEVYLNLNMGKEFRELKPQQ